MTLKARLPKPGWDKGTGRSQKTGQSKELADIKVLARTLKQEGVKYLSTPLIQPGSILVAGAPTVAFSRQVNLGLDTLNDFSKGLPF